MAEPKTRPTAQPVNEFINTLSNPTKKAEAQHLLRIFKEVSGEEPVMWGTSIIGFGSYRYVYASGRSGDWLLTGFSPRKAKHSLYIMSGFERLGSLLAKLGAHQLGKGCLYLKTLSAIDEAVLREIIARSIELVKKRYPTPD
jgi:curved DNA-binding protein CbpA